MSKADGYVLAIDQASNVAGVSLWHNGDLVGVTCLTATSTDSMARRLQTQVPQLTSFLDTHLPAGLLIRKILFEGVRSRLVLITVGAFLTCPRIDAKMHQKFTFVESSAWKKYAQKRGATGPFKEIKGVKALKETGWSPPADLRGVINDDVADSILMYLCWSAQV